MESRDDFFSKLKDGDFLFAADVEDLAAGGRTILQTDERLHRVFHKTKTACLAAISKDLEGLVLTGGGDKAGQGHAITPGLTRADGVEEPANDDWGSVFAHVGEGKEFVHELGAGVAPPAEMGRADEEVVFLGKGVFDALAID